MTPLILPSIQGDLVNVVSHSSANCIHVSTIRKTIFEIQRICNLFRTKYRTGDVALFVSESSTISPYIDEFMHVIHCHCYIAATTFDTEGALKVGSGRIESFGTLIFDRALCKSLKLNSKLGNLIRSNRHRTFVLEFVGNQAGKSKINKRLGIVLNENMDEKLSICNTSIGYCFGVPMLTTSSIIIAARKLEPFTIADNRSTFNRGTEILLIESIARKLKIQLHYEAQNFSLHAG